MMNKSIKAKQQGLTLVEIMIALVLGAFLLGGILQIFQSSKQAYRLQDNMSRLQENGRFAMDFIGRDIRMSDYWGCLRNGLNDVNNIINPAGTDYIAEVHEFDLGISGDDGATGANAALDMPDNLTIRGAFNEELALQGVMANSSAPVVIGANSLEQGDLVLITSCPDTGDIFQISNSSPQSGNLEHEAGVTAPGNVNAALSIAYELDASVYLVKSINYLIQPGANGQPSLWRREDGDAPVELVEGIENMQILYGVDTNTNGTPNFYSATPADMNQVVSIRVSLLVATIEEFLTPQPIDFTYNGATTTPPDLTSPTRSDTRLRRVFTSTFAVRNRLL